MVAGVSELSLAAAISVSEGVDDGDSNGRRRWLRGRQRQSCCVRGRPRMVGGSESIVGV